MAKRDPQAIIDEITFDEGSLGDLQKSSPGRFENCRFNGIKFSEVACLGSSFLDCQFSHCNFSAADLTGSSIRDVEFVACNLMGVNWAALSRFENCRFRDCKLDYGIFHGLKLKRFTCTGSSLTEADFSDADLTEADFSESRLTDALFTGANLSKADLRSATEYAIDPTQARIRGAKFRLPEALALLTALGAEIEF